MRDILFCGKAVDNGEFLNCKGKWVEGGITFFKGGIPYICPERFSDYDEEIEVDPDTVSEYAGLHDKHGKRIFEGYIVKWVANGMTYIDEVVFANGQFTAGDFPLFMITLCNAEVIGNKWDNPELLKGGAV